jgi:tetrahydromethanopterin S-methyltransferase subunit F
VNGLPGQRGANVLGFALGAVAALVILVIVLVFFRG